GDVTTVGVSVSGGDEVGLTNKALAAGRSEGCHLEQGYAAVRSGDAVSARLVAEVDHGRLQHPRRHRAPNLYELPRAEDHRTAPHAGGAGGHRADAAFDAVGVAEHDLYAVEGHTQDRSGHLREDSGVAHAEVLGAHANHHPAIWHGLGLG